MYKYVVIIMLMLAALLVVQPVSANQHETQSSQNLDQANRFLSAEVTRQLNTMKTEISTELKIHQDDNFRIFDQRMHELMDEVRWKIILGALGAFFLGAAVSTYVLQKNMRNYSYEKYLEKQLQQGTFASPDRSMDATQQAQWQPQQPTNTIGMQFGQQAASEMTQMNQWQAQPAYDGAWQSPVQAQPEFNQYPYGTPMNEEGYPASWDNDEMNDQQNDLNQQNNQYRGQQ